MNVEKTVQVLDRKATIGFDEVVSRVMDIAATEKTEIVTALSQDSVVRFEGFTEYGFNALGKVVGFPAPFVLDVAKTNEPLALDIIKDRVWNYFNHGKKPFYTRDFLGKTAGVVSQRYAYFDDKQVVDILDGSPLAAMEFQNPIITPERFHLRALDKDSVFTLNGDDSALFFAYFIDNSMVGQSSFRVQMGVYRVACTNGLILPVNEYSLCRQIHLGKRDIAAEFNESIAFLAEKKEALKELLTNMSTEQATIETIREEFRQAYLQKKLNINQKEADKVLELYYTTYGGVDTDVNAVASESQTGRLRPKATGGTRWNMVNAITEFARDISDINRRESIERLAFRAA